MSHIKDHRISGSTPGFIVQAGGGGDAEMSQDSSLSRWLNSIDHKYTHAGGLGSSKRVTR